MPAAEPAHPASPPGHRLRHRLRQVYLLGAGLALTALAAVQVSGASEAHQRLASDVAFVFAPLVATVSCAIAAARRRTQRRGWALLSLACATWCFGAVAWFVDEILRHQLSPQGSWPAAGFVGYAVPAVLGVTALPVRRPRRASRAWQLLDVTIVWTAVVLVAWVLVLRPGLPGDTLAGLSHHVLLSLYPISDVAVAAVVLVRGMRAHDEHRRMWLCLGAGLLAISLTDTAYSDQLLRNSFFSGSLLDLGWVIAFLLVGLAPLLPRPPRLERRPRGLLQDSLPYAPVVVAVVVLALCGLPLRPPGPTLWLAVLLLVAVTARHLLSTRDHLVLANELEDKVAERTAELEHLAFHDELTGLLGRARFLALVDSAVAARPVRQQVVAGNVLSTYGDPQTLLFLDLDGFTRVNDGFGHAVGDVLLQRVAERLSRYTEGRLLARMGGDEFAVLVRGTARDGEVLASRLLASLTAPFEIDERVLTVTGSVGVVCADGPCAGAAELLSCADTALAAAKAAGRNRCVAFEQHMQASVVARLELEQDLRLALSTARAVGGDELFVVYQPVVDLHTGRVRSAEALVRWRHPVRGLVPPVDFIPVAEQTGLIGSLGCLVLERACAELADWQQRSGRSDLRLSVNVSPAQVDGSLVNDVARVLARHRVDPACLTLELTESAVAEDSEDFRLTISLLKHLGVRLSVDDFGTGYSSLARLRSFDFDELKIDRSFVTDLGRGDDALVATQIGLAHGLGLTTVAEGVETEDELTQLVRLGCDAVQGYLFGRPMPSEDLVRLLDQPLTAAHPTARRAKPGRQYLPSL